MKLTQIPFKNVKGNLMPMQMVDDMSISAEAKMLWMNLYHANKGKGNYKEYTPSTQSLATLFKVDKRTIKRWMKELKDSGWIRVVGDRNNTNVIINIESPLVSRMSPKLVSKMSPNTNKDACAPKVGANASMTTNSEDEKTGEENDTSFELGINNDN